MTDRLTLPLTSVLFFISGALGLGYELVWIRKAALVVGSSQIALATVLTSFFLGLAVGSIVVGRALRSRRWSSLFVYGLFEVAIGIFALLFPTLFAGFGSIYGAVYPAFQDSWIALFLLRFLLLFVLFLVPTFFMGGTLPLLLDGLVARDQTVGSRTSFLYGVNILGAVFGVLVTCYVAIPWLGIEATSRVGGLGNLGIAAVALVAFRRIAPLHVPSSEEDAGDGPERIFAVCSFASGMAAIGYQILWARYFSLFNTNTIYLTAVLLAVYLLALATGSLVLAPLLRGRAHPLRVFALLQPIVPLLVMYGLGWWQPAAYSFAVHDPETLEVVPAWYLVSEAGDATFFAPLLQVGLVIFLPVVLIGTGLPALIAAATSRSVDLRRISGSLVFWNGLGSSAGGFLAGYLLLPTLGLKGALFFLGLVSLGLGAAGEWRLQRDPAGPRRVGGLRPGYLLAGLMLVPCGLFLLQDVTARTIRRHGWGGAPLARDERLIEVREGPLTTAFVFDGPERLSLGAGNVCLAVAPKWVASAQVVQGHLPVLFFPRREEPQDALGICLGSGQSFGALLLYPIERLDVVDISSEIVDLSLEHFQDFNHGLRSDSRVTIHLDDGRHFVERASAASYDVITIEPPPPTAEGVYSLYSLEFYQQVSRVLREQGVFLQWLPLYRVTPKDALGIVSTQLEVFPNTFLIRMGQMDLVLLSFKGEAPRFDTAWIQERIRTFATEHHVAESRWAPGCLHEIGTLEGVLSLIIAGPDDLRGLGGQVYRDDTQRLSYTSGDRELLRRYEGDTLARLSFAALPRTPFRQLARHFEGPIPAADLDAERARSLAWFQVPDPAALARATQRYRDSRDPAVRARLALGIAARQDAWHAKQPALAWVARALESHPRADDPALIEVARRLARNGIAVHAQTLRSWLEVQRPRFGSSPILRVMEAELRAFEEREARRRSAYFGG